MSHNHRHNPGQAQDGQGRLLVSLACYNEAGNLRPLVAEILRHAPDADILVIDDGSPDGTGAVAEELRASNPSVHVLQRGGKLGLGSAIVAAMKFAISHDYDYMINLDADFSHPPRYIPALRSGMASNDVTIGSRYVPGGGSDSDFNAVRRFMSWGINAYARALLGLATKDNSGSYRCYRVAKLREIDLDQIRSRGYSFMEEVLFLCREVGCRMAETPIFFENRRAGYSKINKVEVVRALTIILELGLSRPFRTRRRTPTRPSTPARPPHGRGMSAAIAE